MPLQRKRSKAATQRIVRRAGRTAAGAVQPPAARTFRLGRTALKVGTRLVRKGATKSAGEISRRKKSPPSLKVGTTLRFDKRFKKRLKRRKGR